MPSETRTGKVVLLVENESVPTDRRVWSEACVLRDAGYEVTVVSPLGVDRDSEKSTEIDGISIRRFPLRRADSGLIGFGREYLVALIRMAKIVWRLPGPIKVVHSANPPDLLFVIGLLPKLRWKTKLIFDHHDLVPELFETRFNGNWAALRMVRAVERINFRVADAVVSTNDSYRRIAIERGGKSPDSVRVVRNARDLDLFKRVPPDPALKKGKKFLAVYVGVVGPQDGGECAVRIAAHYRHDLNRDDLQIAFVGDGDSLDNCKALAAELDVADMIDFVGWQSFEGVLRYLSSADIGLATDPPNLLNDRSTMIKVIEYMAIGLPVVSFDLHESMVTAGDAALYAAGGDEKEFAAQLARLTDDAELRRELSDRAEQRSTGAFAWATARDQLLSIYSFVEDGSVESNT